MRLLALLAHGSSAAPAQQSVAPTTVAAALIVYVMCPLIVASVIGLVRWTTGHTRRMDELKQAIGDRMGDQERALALLVQEVTPPHGVPLRELVNDSRISMADLRGEVHTLSALIAGRDIRPPPRPPPLPGGGQ